MSIIKRADIGTVLINPVLVDDVSVTTNIEFVSEAAHTIEILDSTNAGINGGDLYISSGKGAIGDVDTAGADGGDLTLQANKGGDGSAAQVAGASGNVYLITDSAGADGGAGGAVSGYITIDTGSPSGGANAGAVYVGTSNAYAVNISRSGKETVVYGDLVLSANVNLAKEINHNVSIIGSTTPGVVGGSLTVFAADGTPADATNAGADGGSIFINAGAGGDAGADQPAGDGGILNHSGGFGGDGSATQLGGSGGSINLVAGDAGTDGGFGTGNGGSYSIDAGSGTLNGAVSVGTSNADVVFIGRAGKTTLVGGNLGLGVIAPGTDGTNILALTNAATAPSTSTDMVQLYGQDISAGNATLGLTAETAVAVSVATASTHSLTIFINGAKYKLLLALVP